MIKTCLECGKEFRTYLSFNCDCCSVSCSNKRKWKNPTYRQHMSDVHKGKPSNMKGKNHTRESILKARQSHKKIDGDCLKNGYVYVYSPDHPHAINSRIPKQVEIVESVLGRYLHKNEVVHHVNGIKTDNRNENLLVCSETYHKVLHAKINGFGTKIQSNPQRDRTTGKFVRAMKGGTHIPGIQVYED